MLDSLVQNRIINENYNFVIITLDSHAAGPAKRILPNLKDEFPNLSIKIHAAADWAENPKLLEKAKKKTAATFTLGKKALDKQDIVVGLEYGLIIKK